jgi:phage shock protein PspC (stress-responsive transcriptional regulator)
LFESLQRLPFLLQCNIALATSGQNSQLSVTSAGELSQPLAFRQAKTLNSLYFHVWHSACFDSGDNANRSFPMTVATAEYQNDQLATEKREPALPLRSDTFLGVCEAIGQDFGFNPNWLRIAFAPLIIMSPLSAMGAYLALGCVVAVARWLFPVALANAAQIDAGETGPAADYGQSEDRLAA